MKNGIRHRVSKGLYILIVTVIILISLALWGYFAVSFWHTNEPRTTVKKTTVKQVHSISEIKAATSFYPFLRKTFDIYQGDVENGTYQIPGLYETGTMRAGTVDVCTSMVPQSVCVVENYLLIGAYCKTEVHYSVIYVLDKYTHQYIKTVVLPARYHMGGIAYDKIHHNIWISGYADHAQANIITLKQLNGYNFKYCKRPIAFAKKNNLYTIPKNSFMAYYQNCLYVGYFQPNNESIIQKFELKKNGQLRLKNSAKYQQSYHKRLPKKIAMPVNVSTIDRKVQGVAFSNYRMFVSESYGILPSKLAMFSIKHDDEKDQEYVNKNAISIISMPQKLEQIMVDGENLYTIYESGAYAYRHYSFPCIDRVIPLKVSEVSRFGNPEKSDNNNLIFDPFLKE